jgi:hypothetical protein
MVTESHCSHDRRKLLEVLLLGRQERRPLEEGNHALKEISTSSYDVDKSTIFPSVGLDVTATTESLAYQPKHLSPVTVLADMKLRYQLIPAATGRVAVDSDGETALTINIARNVAIQPFLLIVRTHHIFTVSIAPVGMIATSSVGYSDFPAYSRIYRQQRNLLSHDVLNPARVPL